jgi:Transposase DDE domain
MTDADSAKMLTSKGAIQGYAAQAAVDSQSQIIVAADAIGSGSEQSMLIPMVDQANSFLKPQTLITANTGYFSDANVQALHDLGIPALIADTMMRQRDQRFRDAARFRVSMFHDKRANKNHKMQTPLREFTFVDEQTALCPQGKSMHGLGTFYTTERGLPFRRYEAQAQDSVICSNKAKCKRKPGSNRGRQIAIYLSKPIDDNSASELMKQAIDSERGRPLYSQRVGTVEPVFANLRTTKVRIVLPCAEKPKSPRSGVCIA